MSNSSNSSGYPCPAADPIICDPIVVVQDCYYTQVVPVIHTIQVVKRTHCVPIEKHIYNYVNVEEGNSEMAGVSGQQKEKKRHATVSKAKTKSKSKSKK